MADYTAVPEFTLSEPRVGTMQGFRHFYVPGRASMRDIAQVAGDLIDRVSAAYAGADTAVNGPVNLILSYSMPDESGEFDIAAGFSVAPGVEPAGEAQVEDVAGYRCASLVLSGRLVNLKEAHEALTKFVQEQGLQFGPAFREWYLYWEDDSSPNNVILITYELAE
ncbi:MAG: GyrI-like domain-containing protein [Anaerolineae bacterium]|jgi:effector-binding domain-containing protein